MIKGKLYIPYQECSTKLTLKQPHKYWNNNITLPVSMRIDQQQKTRVIYDRSVVDGTINWKMQEKFETREIFDSRRPGTTGEDQGPG